MVPPRHTRRSWHRRWRPVAVLLAVFAPDSAPAQTLAPGTTPPRVIGVFGDWTAAVQTASFQTLCYAFTRAARSTGAVADRGPVMLWTTRGRSGGETIRFDAGFVFAPNVAVAVQTGQATLYFNTAQNRAFPANGAEAVAAFSRSDRLFADTTAPGPNGAPVTDSFSLRGFAAAQEAIRGACPGVVARAAIGVAVPVGSPVVESPGETRVGLGGTRTVRLARAGGILVAPARVNDALTLHFAVDSGAVDVSIPEEAVEALRQTGTLADSDFTGQRIYMTADGTRSAAATFLLRVLEVGGQRVENVTAHVSPARSPLLLGQSFLGRFRSWSIDNDRQELVLGQAAR